MSKRNSPTTPTSYTPVNRQGSDTDSNASTGTVSPQKAAARALSAPVTPKGQGGKGKKKGKQKKGRKNKAQDNNNNFEMKATTVVAPLPQLSKDEFEFFELVKSGDAIQVRDFIFGGKLRDLGIDINKTDKTGYTVLHVAVRRQDEDMVKVLVRNKDIRLYDTLLHAIKEKNVAITKILLDKYDKDKSAATAQQISGGGSTQSSHQIIVPFTNPSGTSQMPPNAPISGHSGVISTFQMFIPIDPSPPPSPTASNQTTQPSPTASGQTSPPSRTNSPQSTTSKSKKRDDEDDMKVIKEMTFDSAFPPVITPLMLAAQESCLPLMELFYERGERLETEEYPHIGGCECDICAKLEGDQDMTRAYQRYHLFKALTEPEYICFIARKEKKDPVNYALQKIVKVREIIARDMAFNRLFEGFEESLEEFVSKLLQLCRNTTETEIFLSPKDSEERLPHLYPRLWYTVGLGLKKFVAQPNAQNLVYKLWATDDWPKWDTYGWISRSCMIASRIVLFPVFALILLVAQDTGFGRKCGAPVSRFLTYIGSYIFFLFLVGIQALFPYQRCNDDPPYYTIDDNSCTKRGPPTIGTEWPLVIYIMSFYVSMLKRHSVSWYWRMRWNWFEFISQLAFTATFICWAWSWIWLQNPDHDKMKIGSKRVMWPHDSPEIFSECFLSLAFLLAGGRLLRFFTVLPELGPIQIALGKQIIDFLSTGLIMMVVIFAFASGMMALFVPYKDCNGTDPDDHNRRKAQEDAFQDPSNAIKTLFFMLYEHGGPDVVKLLTWSGKNDTDGNGVEERVTHKYTQLTAQFLYLTYHVIGVTMLFSMLSGYFAQTVEHVMENVDVEWKYARTELYLTFIKDTVLPPPFNLIPTLNSICGGVKFLLLMVQKTKPDGPKAAFSFRQCCYITSSKKTDKWKRLMRGYRKLVVQLIFRYRNLREEENGEEEATKDDVLELAEELAEIKALLSKHAGVGSPEDENAKARAAVKSRENVQKGGSGTGGGGGGGGGSDHGGGAAGSGTGTGGGSNITGVGSGVGNSSSGTGTKSPGPGTSTSAGGGTNAQSGTSVGKPSTSNPSTTSTVPPAKSGGKPSTQSGMLSMLFVAQSALSTPKRSSGLMDFTGSSGGAHSMENRNNNTQGSSKCTTCSANSSQFQEMMPPPEKISGLMDFSGSDFNQTSGDRYGAREQDLGYRTPPKGVSHFSADVTPKKPVGLVDFTGSTPETEQAHDYRQPRRGSRSGGGLERPSGLRDFSGRGSLDNGNVTPPGNSASYTISSEVTPKKPVGLIDFTGKTPPEGNKQSSSHSKSQEMPKSSNQFWENMDPAPTKSTGLVDFTTGDGYNQSGNNSQSRRDSRGGAAKERSTGRANFPGYPTKSTMQYMPMPDLNYEPVNNGDYKEPRKGSRSGGGLERSTGLEDFSGPGNVESAYQPVPTSSNFYGADLPPKKPVGLVDFTGSSPTYETNQSKSQNEGMTRQPTSHPSIEIHDYTVPRRGSRSGGGLERSVGLEDFSGLGNVESAYQPIQQSASYYSAEITPKKTVGLVDYTGMSVPPENNTRSKEGQSRSGQQIQMPMPGTSYTSLKGNPFTCDYKEPRRGSRSGGGLERSVGLEDFSGAGSVESAFGTYMEPELPQKRPSGLIDFTGSTANNNKTTERRRGSNELPPRGYPHVSQHSQGRHLSKTSIHQNERMKYTEAPPPDRILRNVSKMTVDELRDSSIWDSPDAPVAEIKYKSSRRNKRDDEMYSPSTSPSMVPSPTKGSRIPTPIPLRLSDDNDTGVATDGSSKQNYGWRM